MKHPKHTNRKTDKVEEPAVSYPINNPSTTPLKTDTPPIGYMTSQQFRTELTAELKEFYIKNGLL